MVSVTSNVKKGLTPNRKRGANYNSTGFNLYPIENGYAQNLFKGDPVKVSGGYIQLAANGNTPIGVFLGCVYPSTEVPLKHNSYFPSGTSVGAGDGFIDGVQKPLAMVNDDPNQTYYILARTSSGAAGLAIGSYAKVSAAGTGSTQNGQSYAELDITGTDVSVGAAMFKIVDHVKFPGWDEDADATVVEVIFNPNLTSNA